MRVGAKIACLLMGCLGISLATMAGVYMGTQEMPYQQDINAGQPPVSMPFVGNPSYQEAYLQTYGNCEPFSGKGPMPANPCPGIAPPMITPPLVIYVHPGSLKHNIERITREAGWEKLIWKPTFDYEWVGNVTITANDIQGILSKLLEPYPLQAIFYNANHVVEITPRRNT